MSNDPRILLIDDSPPFSRWWLITCSRAATGGWSSPPFPEPGGQVYGLSAAADQALYAAKHSGRDRINIAKSLNP